MGVKYLPYGEDTDNYIVEVLSTTAPRSVLRTISVTGATTTTYTASQQTSDGLTLGNAVYVKIYQISNAVGRGRAHIVKLDASSTPNYQYAGKIQNT